VVARAHKLIPEKKALNNKFNKFSLKLVTFLPGTISVSQEPRKKINHLTSFSFLKMRDERQLESGKLKLK
jgi:hypothetical protein